MKKSIIRLSQVTALSLLFVACGTSEKKTDGPATDKDTTATEVVVVDDAMKYALDWNAFQDMVRVGTKENVLKYVDQSNTELLNDLTTDFEYYFDADFIDLVNKTEYEDLEVGVYNDKKARVLQISHAIADADMVMESTYFFYFVETPSGIQLAHVDIAG